MTPRLILIPLLTLMAVANAASALAQDKGTVDPKPLPPLANPNDPKIGAKELFGRKVLPAAMPTRVLGFYAHGCIAGAEGLPINGDTWQVMRLSRNRYWAPSRHGRAGEAAGREGAQGCRLARHIWSATCRSRAAARCSPATPAIRWGSTPTSG